MTLQQLKTTPITNNDTLDSLVKMTYATNLVALDKAIWHAKRDGRYSARAEWSGVLAERMVRAIREIGMCLPKDLR